MNSKPRVFAYTLAQEIHQEEMLKEVSGGGTQSAMTHNTTMSPSGTTKDNIDINMDYSLDW
jgi:hypothetical protein